MEHDLINNKYIQTNGIHDFIQFIQAFNISFSNTMAPIGASFVEVKDLYINDEYSLPEYSDKLNELFNRFDGALDQLHKDDSIDDNEKHKFYTRLRSDISNAKENIVKGLSQMEARYKLSEDDLKRWKEIETISKAYHAGKIDIPNDDEPGFTLAEFSSADSKFQVYILNNHYENIFIRAIGKLENYILISNKHSKTHIDQTQLAPFQFNTDLTSYQLAYLFERLIDAGYIHNVTKKEVYQFLSISARIRDNRKPDEKIYRFMNPDYLKNRKNKLSEADVIVEQQKLQKILKEVFNID